MSRIRADRLTNKEGTGAPLFPNGIRVVGLTSLSNVIAGVTTFTSDVSIGGTLTYEDVTNIDSVGMVTARTGIKVLAGGINVVGVITATSYDGIDSTSLKDSSGNIKAQATSTGIGIGTITPNYTLELSGASSNNYISLVNTTAGDADGNRFSRILFRGTQSGGEVTSLAAINGAHEGTADDQKGNISFRTNDGSDGESPTERLRIGPAGQIGLSGANYGTDGQVLTSKGASAAVQWATPSGTETLLSTTSMNNKSSSTPIEFTSLDFTTYPRGFKFITSPWTVKDSGGSWMNSGHNNMRIVVGNSGGYIGGSNYAYHIMEQRSNTQNLELSATAGTDVISQGISIAKAQYFEFELHAADVTAGDTDASPAGITNSFSSKLKYRIQNGTDYNDMNTRWLEGAIVLNTNTDEQATKIKFYPGSSGIFNGGTMRAYGLK